MGNECCREGAERVLIHRTARMRKRLEALQILHDKIPWDDLTKEEEELLWSFFCSADPFSGS